MRGEAWSRVPGGTTRGPHRDATGGPSPVAIRLGRRVERSAPLRARASVTGLERGLERGEVRQLFGQALQALEDARHLALRPLELLVAHLSERAAQLVVEADEALDAGDTGL